MFVSSKNLKQFQSLGFLSLKGNSYLDFASFQVWMNFESES